MPNIHPEVLTTASVLSNPTQLVAAVPASIVGVGAFAKSFTIVHQSEMGVRMRGGAPMLKPEVQERIFAEIWSEIVINGEGYNISQLPRHERKERVQEKIAELPEEVAEQGIYETVGQGIVWLRPFIDRVVKINVADQTTPLDPFEIWSEDKKLVHIAPGITWRVMEDGDNPFRALFKINNEKETGLKDKTIELEQTIAASARTSLGIALRGRNFDSLMGFDPEEITASTREKCQAQLGKYGVRLENVWLDPPTPTAAERLAQSIESSPLDPSRAALVLATSMLAGGAVGSERRLRSVPLPDDAA